MATLLDFAANEQKALEVIFWLTGVAHYALYREFGSANGCSATSFTQKPTICFRPN